MSLTLLSLFLSAVAISAQDLLSRPAFVAALNPSQALPTPSFHPTNVANTLVFWNYRDTPNGTTLSWTDEVSKVVLTNWAPMYTKPTNTALGWHFPSFSGMTNVAFSTANSFSVWFVAATLIASSPYIYGTETQSGSALLVNDYTFYGKWNGFEHPLAGYLIGGAVVGGGGQISNAPVWADIVDAQGLVYTNGVTAGSSISSPSTPVTWSEMGNNVGNTGFLNGFIKYLLISTNHAITATEAYRLWTWEQTNGVTNVTNGLVAWWKLADATNSATILDSSGNGWTGTLKGSPKPGFTNGLNSVVSQGIAFDGTQNYIDIPVTDKFLEGPSVSVSMWLNFTLSTNAAFLGSAGATPPGYANFSVFCDGQYSGNGNGPVRGAVGDASGINFLESGNPGIGDGKWHHFVMASDGTHIFNWFDGVADYGDYGGQQAFGGGSTPVNWYAGMTNVCLGAARSGQINGSYDRIYMPCALTDIRIYNRVLNDGEVDILYRAPMADKIVGSYAY